MIPVEAAKVAISQVELFDRRGEILTTMGQTPVATIMSTIGMRSCYAGATEYSPTPESVSYMSTGDCTDGPISLCSKAIEALAADIGGEIEKHLFFTRNTVQPVIKLVAASIKAHTDRIPPDVDKTITVIERELPPPMFDLEDDINKFSDAPYRAINQRILVGDKSPPEIIELMLTGKKGVDAKLSAWAIGQDPLLLQNIWDALFTAKETLAADAILRDPEKSVASALVAYLCASKMYEKIPEGINSSLGTFRAFLTLVMEQCAKVMIGGFEDEHQAIKSGRIVFANVFRKVYVNKTVYRQWLSEGGVEQAIYGNSLMAVPFFFVDQIKENQSALISRWRDYTLQSATGEAERRHALIRDIIKDAFDDVVVQNFKMCFCHLCDDPTPERNQSDYAAFRAKLAMVTARMANADYEKDPWNFVINLVLDCLYEKAPCARRILDGISQASRVNPDATPEECASLATLTYIADFCADQIVI